MTDRPDPSPVDPWATDPTPTQRTPLPAPGPAAQAPAAAPAPAAQSPAAPPWRRARRDDGRAGSIVFGLILLGIGAWFFLEQTLGFDLPELRWDQLWPVILIALGLWIVVGARRGAD